MISRQRLYNAKKKAKHRMERYRRDPDLDMEWFKKQLYLLRHITKHCSGPCCGNPRRHFGEKTVQERRAQYNKHERNNMEDKDNAPDEEVKPAKGSFTVNRLGEQITVWFNEDTRTVGAIVVSYHCGKRVKFKGIAKCSPEDEFSIKYGATLAIKRALLAKAQMDIDETRKIYKSELATKEQIIKSCDARLEKLVPGSTKTAKKERMS